MQFQAQLYLKETKGHKKMRLSRHFKKWHIVIFIAVLHTFFCITTTTSWCNAQEQPSGDSPIATYQKNRQAFVAEQQQANQSFSSQAAALQKEIESLKQENDAKHKDLNRLQSVIAGHRQETGAMAQIQSAASFVLFPLLSAWSMATSFLSEGHYSAILLLFLSIAVVNVFLYLMFKQQRIFQRNRIPLIIAVVILIGCIASPLFAEEQTKRDQVIAKLERAERMLSKSDYERFIAILEEKPTQRIKVPVLQSGDPLFTVYQEVIIDSPEYWSTLAALYTHEKQNGKALEAVKKIVKDSRVQRIDEHQKILVNGFRYLLQEQQTQEVSAAVDALGGAAIEAPTLLKIATLLKQSGMQASAEKTLGYAIAKAGTVVDLAHLAQYFLEQQAIDRSNEALEKALARARDMGEILMLAETALTVGKDVLIGKIVVAADTVTNDSQAKMKVVDLFLQKNRKEEAVNLVSRIIKASTSRNKENVDKLLYVIDASLKRNLLPQAADATETLIVMLGLHQAKNYPIQSGASLKSAQGIPNQGAITLPQFLGLIKEEQGQSDKAEEAYIFSVLASLTTILESYGYNFPDSLNDFYLLGRNWAGGNRNDLIGQLDRVYSIIEKQFITQQVLKNDEQLGFLKKEIEELTKASTELRTSISESERQASRAMVKMVLQSLSTVATVAFVLAALIGCGVLAYRYCQGLTMGRTFGFIMKLGETTGWLQVLSILGAVTGLASILVAQALLMFQMIQENTHRVAAGFPPLSPSRVNLARELPQQDNAT